MREPLILVVEDEPNQRETLTTILAVIGFKTVPASDVDEALSILRREPVDAVTLDIIMPDPKGLERNGLTFLVHLRSIPKYADLPVLVFTGADLKAEEEELITRLRGKLFRKPQPYADIIDELNRRVIPA